MRFAWILILLFASPLFGPFFLLPLCLAVILACRSVDQGQHAVHHARKLDRQRHLLGNARLIPTKR